MQESRFEAIQRDAGALIARDPHQYARVIRRWHHLAIAYVVFILALPVIGLGVSLGLALTTPGFILTKSLLAGIFAKLSWLTVKLVFGKNTVADANVLTRDQAPRLFDLVARVCERLVIDPPQRIAMNDTAYIQLDIQRRWRVFGSEITTLNIGWQLLFCISERELEALIAIQVAERCATTGNPNIQTSERSVTEWHTFAQHAATSKNPIRHLFRPFFAWWQPKQYAWTIVGARQAQIDAVRAAVEVTCSTATARALLNVNLFGEHLDEEFYPELFRSAAHDCIPPFDLADRLAAQTGVIDAHFRKSLTASELAIVTHTTSLHLSLADRLAAIRTNPTTADFFTTPAAWLTVFNGKDDVLLRSLIERWRDTQSEWWQLTHDRYQLEHGEIEQLESKRLDVDMPVEEHLRHAELIARRDGTDTARPLYAQIYERYPKHPMAAYMEGVHLLTTNRESGVPLICYAIAQNSGWDVAWGGWSAIRQYAERAKNLDLLQQASLELGRAQVLFEEYERERRELSSSDIFGHHGLDNETLQRCSEWLNQCPDVAEACLYTKKVLVKPEETLLVMVIRRHPGTSIEGGVGDVYHAHIERINESGLGFTIAVFDHDSLGEIKPEQRLTHPESCRIYFSSLMNKPTRRAARITLVEASFTAAFTGLGLGFLLVAFVLAYMASGSAPHPVVDLLPVNSPAAMMIVPLIGCTVGAIIGYRKRHQKLFAHREAANVLLS